MTILTRPLASLGAAALNLLAALGRISIYAFSTLRHIFRRPFYLRELGIAILNVGWLSLPVVGLTAVFTGGALALQIYAGGARFNAEAVVPQIVAIGMVRMTHWDAGSELDVLTPNGIQPVTVWETFWI